VLSPTGLMTYGSKVEDKRQWDAVIEWARVTEEEEAVYALVWRSSRSLGTHKLP
jgi:hypothetical protein